MVTDVLIIGPGLFGSMIAKVLRNNLPSLKVILIDRKDEYSASKCSFGLFKQGWYDKIKTEAEISIPILKEHTKLRQVEVFDMDKLETEMFYHVDPNSILNEDVIYGDVIRIDTDSIQYLDENKDKKLILARRMIIVAAGVKTYDLLKLNGFLAGNLDGYWGAVMTYKKNIDISRIQTWAPFKHSIALKLDESNFKFGDGSTVKNIKKQDPRIEKVSDRMIRNAQKLLGISDLTQIISVQEGIRPYLITPKGSKPRYIEQHSKKIWSATGGAKNSTLLSGYIAYEFYKKLR